MTYTRREFIQLGGAATGALALGAGLTTKWFGHDTDATHDPATDGDHVVPTFCELCFWKCGVLAHVKDGRVTKLVGNPEHPLSRGRLCPRGTGGVGLLYDPDRLRKPMVRRDVRGAQVFETVSWDAALNEVAEKMLRIKERHGPEALALFSHGYGGSWWKHLMAAFGSAAVVAPSYAQCRGPREAGFMLTFGQGLGSPEPLDIGHTRCLTLIGSHLGENMHNTQVQDFADAVGGGARLIVVDPRFSVAAGKAQHWLPIKPGTDLALLLAWMHVLIEEKLYDESYIAQHALGFDKLREHVKDKTPEWAFTQTSIAPEKIVETARVMAAARPASLVHPGRHVTWYGDDSQRSRAIAILNALLGSYGRRGGIYLGSAMNLPKYPTPKYTHTPKAPADAPRGKAYPFAEEVLASGVCEATIPGTAAYDYKGWIIYGSNLIQALPNPAQTIKALQALELVVAIDVLPAEIVGYADVVLPECTYLERHDDIDAPAYREPFLAIRQPAVPPMFDSKPGWWMAKELGRRLGLQDQFPWADAESFIKHRVEAAGHDFVQLKKKGALLGPAPATTTNNGLQLSFATPSKKIELYSEQLAKAGLEPLPVYRAPDEPPAGMFRLLAGRSPVHTFGRTTNNRFLSTVTNENELWLNARVALELGLKAGQRVVLTNQDGVRSDPIKLKATQRIRPDCVYMVHGYGHDAKGLKFARGRGASDSQLTTRYVTDPIMGGTGMNVNFVRVEKAPAEPRAKTKVAARPAHGGGAA